MEGLYVILELTAKLDPLASHCRETLVINALDVVSGSIRGNFRLSVEIINVD